MSIKSRHFGVDEFRCHSGERYPIGLEETRLQPLVTMLDIIRGAMNEPIVVICGYRTEAYNKALREASLKRNGGISGVAIKSQHTEGRAADIAPLRRDWHSIAILNDMIVQLYADGRIPMLGGLGFYPGQWVHVDTREKVNNKLVRWDGNGNGNGSDQ